jgi:Na+/H+-translocating membrane pyrophosphatase
VSPWYILNLLSGEIVLIHPKLSCLPILLIFDRIFVLNQPRLNSKNHKENNKFMPRLEILSGLIAILSLGYVVYLIRWIWRQDMGEEKMRAIADAIREGANAFLKRQYRTIGILSIVVTILLFAAYAIGGNPRLGFEIATAFLFGAICSAIAGFIGMYISVRTNIRVAAVAKHGMNASLVTAFLSSISFMISCLGIR